MENPRTEAKALYTAYLWRLLKFKEEEKEPTLEELSRREPDHRALVWTSSPARAGQVCQLLALETDVKAGVYEKPNLESFGYPVTLLTCAPGRTLVISGWKYFLELDPDLLSRAGKHFPPQTMVEEYKEKDQRLLFHALFFDPGPDLPTGAELHQGIASGSIPVQGECFFCVPPGQDLNPLLREIGQKRGFHQDPEGISALYHEMKSPMVIWGAEIRVVEGGGDTREA